MRTVYHTLGERMSGNFCRVSELRDEKAENRYRLFNKLNIFGTHLMETFEMKRK